MSSTEPPATTTTYQTGDRVERLEDRETVAATVLSVHSVGDEVVLELQYDEGGTGWWPATSVRPLPGVA